MLKNDHVALLLRILNHLNASGAHKGSAALAADLGAMLQADADTRATVAAASAARRAPGKGSGQKVLFTIVTEPGAAAHYWGAAAAHAALENTLAELGGTRSAPTRQSFAVTMSTKGVWYTMIETDNGTVVVTARRATDKEMAQILQ